jgi:hypothetical protein
MDNKMAINISRDGTIQIIHPENPVIKGDCASCALKEGKSISLLTDAYINKSMKNVETRSVKDLLKEVVGCIW